jgi:hypothetical protein
MELKEYVQLLTSPHETGFKIVLAHDVLVNALF